MKFCLSRYYNGSNSYLFVDGVKMYQLKVKDSEFVNYAVCSANIPKDFSVGDMMQTGLNGYMNDFSVGFRSIDVDDILDLHKYLMNRNKYNVWVY